MRSQPFNPLNPNCVYDMGISPDGEAKRSMPNGFDDESRDSATIKVRTERLRHYANTVMVPASARQRPFGDNEFNASERRSTR